VHTSDPRPDIRIEIDQVAGSSVSPRLSAYLENLDERCEGELRAGLVDRPGIDVSDAHEVGLWDPTRRTWTLPYG
jgi:hypothetical protein